MVWVLNVQGFLLIAPSAIQTINLDTFREEIIPLISRSSMGTAIANFYIKVYKRITK